MGVARTSDHVLILVLDVVRLVYDLVVLVVEPEERHDGPDVPSSRECVSAHSDIASRTTRERDSISASWTSSSTEDTGITAMARTLSSA
jgi:hypothetical protein